MSNKSKILPWERGPILEPIALGGTRKGKATVEKGDIINIVTGEVSSGWSKKESLCFSCKHFGKFDKCQKAKKVTSFDKKYTVYCMEHEEEGDNV